MEERRRSRLPRGLLAVLILVLVLAAIVPLGIALALRPRARDKVVELLEKRFDRVQLESLEVRFARNSYTMTVVSRLYVKAQRGHVLCSFKQPEKDNAELRQS